MRIHGLSLSSPGINSTRIVPQHIFHTTHKKHITGVTRTRRDPPSLPSPQPPCTYVLTFLRFHSINRSDHVPALASTSTDTKTLPHDFLHRAAIIPYRTFMPRLSRDRIVDIRQTAFRVLAKARIHTQTHTNTHLPLILQPATRHLLRVLVKGIVHGRTKEPGWRCEVSPDSEMMPSAPTGAKWTPRRRASHRW